MSKTQASQSSEPLNEGWNEVIAESVAFETVNHLIDAALARHAKN